MTDRIDSATGLRLVASPSAPVFRVAKSSYGPMNPPVREGSKRRGWNRWDTPGRTVYTSDSTETAYIEAMAWAHEEAANHDRAIRKTAEHFGISAKEAREMVEADWLKAGNMQPGWLPTIWRDGRRMYQLTFRGLGSHGTGLNAKDR